MYPFDLKTAGATRAEMLALKTMMLVNVCACFDVMISDHKSRVACKAAPPLFFLSFGTQLFFFLFLFSFLQCFWPCPFFFLHGPMLIWKSYNLNRFAKPTRCHPFNSFLQQPGVITCMVVILFATRGSIPLKNNHDEEFKSQVFYWSCYVYCCERYDNQREESFKRWGKRRIHGIFLLSSRLQHWVLAHFFQVLLTWLNPL